MPHGWAAVSFRLQRLGVCWLAAFTWWAALPSMLAALNTVMYSERWNRRQEFARRNVCPLAISM